MKTFIAILGLLLISTYSTAFAREAFPKASQLGLSVGTPAGINLEYSYEFGKHAVYVCGMYYGSDELYGFQVGLSLARDGKPRKYFSVNLVGGDTFANDDYPHSDIRWAYGGVEVYFRYHALFLAPALTFGNGTDRNGYDFSSPQVIGRLGMTWTL